ncbi:MAG: hypothetical protein JSU72_07455 [Deltaproteobacteria bacterium]|nr:MAG: hypothetical protein JSU72_07455 [Deltaproteobacteria bacterium]
MFIEETEQQVRIWLRLAHEAYGERLVLRSLQYFHRALDYAESKQLNREVAVICRDLGYVYAREGSTSRALMVLDQGLAVTDMTLPIRVGILFNKASVLVKLGVYGEALVLLENSSQIIRSHYPDFSKAPGQIVHSYAAIAQMEGDLRKLVELLDMGISAERIQVEVRSQKPPWLRQGN